MFLDRQKISRYSMYISRLRLYIGFNVACLLDRIRIIGFVGKVLLCISTAADHKFTFFFLLGGIFLHPKRQLLGFFS